VTRVVVLGGTGFVGRHLSDRFAATAGIQPLFIAHRRRPDWAGPAFVDCPLEDVAALRDHLTGADVVVNLLRPDGSGDRLRDIQRIITILGQHPPSRVIHASSITVHEGVAAPVVTEDTAPAPTSDYAREHVAIERSLASVEGRIVLRLGAVFGAGGVNLVKFAEEARTGSLARLALRRCGYGERRMHLVSVETVVAAIAHLAVAAPDAPGVLLLTDDEDQRNTFGFVQDTLLEAFGRPRLAALPNLPPAVLEAVLRRMGRRDGAVRQRYVTRFPDVLSDVRVDFGAALSRYAHLLAGSSGR
jgi:nucleoside-diphosphate-sugar epimerase